MSLYNGIDPTAIITNGVYSETFGSINPSAIANLSASFGLIEDAPEYIAIIIAYVACGLGLDLSLYI